MVCSPQNAKQQRSKTVSNREDPGLNWVPHRSGQCRTIPMPTLTSSTVAATASSSGRKPPDLVDTVVNFGDAEGAGCLALVDESHGMETHMRWCCLEDDAVDTRQGRSCQR
jgi:hypothetical protein